MMLPLCLSLLLRNQEILSRPTTAQQDRDLHELICTNHFGLVVLKTLSRLPWGRRWEDQDTATDAALFE